MTDADQLYADAPESASYPLSPSSGRLPEGLRGTFLRVGPGIQGVGDRRFNLLDGYGFVAGVSFGLGEAHFRARHVRTPAFERERSAGRQLSRRPFTNKPGRWSNLGDLAIAEGANHDVLAWGGQVVATDAPGHRALDPRTLETQGAGELNRLRAAKFSTLCQMPRPDFANGRLVAFSTLPGLLSDRVTFSELERDWSVATKRTYSLGAPGVVLHDLAFTSAHYLALEIGRLRLGRALWGDRTFYNSLGGEVLHVYVFPRHGEAPTRRVPLPLGAQAFHFFNAFRDGEDVVFDFVLYDQRIDFDLFRPPGSARPVVAMANVHPRVVRARLREGEQKLELHPYEARGEAPCVHPGLHGQRHRYGYFAAETERGDEDAPGASFYFHGVGAIDFDSGETVCWSAGPRGFCSPPAFTPKPGAKSENEGWLLSWMLDTAREQTSVVVLDAQHVADGPVVVLPLQHALPAVSHVEFAPDIMFA